MKNKIIFFIVTPLIINAQNKIHKTLTYHSLNCSTCHACEIPTRENPCLKACPREYMIRIDQKPQDAPKYLTINKIKETDIYEPVVFSHLTHSEMADISGGCRTCHHYNPPGNVIACSECHEAQRKSTDVSKPDLMGAFHRQCMNCHIAWSGSTDCILCHQLKGKETKIVKETKPTPVKRVHPEIEVPDKILFSTASYTTGKLVTFYHREHINLFGYECGDCHSNDNCVKCHKKNRIVKTVKKSLKEIHKKCSNCHDTDSKSNCKTCHSEKVKSPFNHLERTGFDISKYHSKLKCNRCHTRENQFTGLNSECKFCHSEWNFNNFKHSVTGLKLDDIHTEFECNNCHKEPTYSNNDCTDCHDDKLYPKDKPGHLVKK